MRSELAEAAIGFSFCSMDYVRKLHRILNKEDWNVVTNQLLVAVLVINLTANPAAKLAAWRVNELLSVAVPLRADQPAIYCVKLLSIVYIASNVEYVARRTQRGSRIPASKRCSNAA